MLYDYFSQCTLYNNPPSTPSLYSEQNFLIGFNNVVFVKILQQIQKRNFSELTNEIIIQIKNLINYKHLK